MQNPTANACPNCGQSDAVYPVPIVVTGVAPNTSMTDTNLAGPRVQVAPPEVVQQLRPPVFGPEPQRKDFPASAHRVPDSNAGPSIGGKVDGALIILWFILTVGLIIWVAGFDTDIVEYLGTGIAIATIVLVYCFRQFVLKNLPIAALRNYYTNEAKDDAAAEARAFEAYNIALAQYKETRAAETRWHNLQYCARCNGVFDPQERRFIPAAQAAEYIGAMPAMRDA